MTARHILSVFSTFAVGGPQIRFCALANHFGPALRHSIIAMDGHLDAQKNLDPALNVSFPNLTLNRQDTLGNIRRIITFLRAQRPDLLLTSNWGTIDWALARNITRTRHVHMEDGFGPEERSTQLPRRVLTRRLALRGSQVIVPSLTLKNIAENVWRLPKSRLTYIPNGINLARFHNAAPARVPPGEGLVIGTIAALRPEKNLARLLRAFHQLRSQIPARLVIVGDGPERPALESLSAELNLTQYCHFAGHSSAPESWLAAFDVFALSSDTEQMPLSVLEAAAASLPIAATDVGDIRAMLAPENALYLTPKDDVALADALRSLLTAPGASAIGAANRAKAERDFSEDTMFRAYANLILPVL